METEVKQEKESNWKISTSTDWKVRIPRALYDKIFMYTACIDTEIAGFGDIEVDKDKKEYVITRLRMYKQKVTGASVDQDEKALGEMIENALMSGEDLSKIKFEWHSHVNMGVFWSGTDDECCKMLVNCSKDFYVFFVVNKKGELLARVDYLCQLPEHTMQITNYCIPVVIEEPTDNTLKVEVEADIEKYIDKAASAPQSYGYGGYRGGQYELDYSCDYLCDTCKDSNKKVRWHQDTHNWICKDCFEEKMKEFTKNVKSNGIKTWSKCEECAESSLGRWDKGRWMCYTCLRRERIDAKLNKDDRNTFQDDRGRHWIWGQCQCCVDSTGTIYEEYVTNVKEVKKLMCDQCFAEYEVESKKGATGGLICQDTI